MKEKKGKSGKAKTEVDVPFFSLFRYSSLAEKSLMFIGSACSIFAAIGLPLMIVLYGEYTTLLVDRKIGNSSLSPTSIIQSFGGGRTEMDGTEEDLRAAIKEDAVAFGMGSVAAAAFQFIFCFLSVLILNYASLRQSARIRRLFLKSILRQDVGWFDLSNANNFASRITEDLDKIQEGIGEKIGLFLFLLLSFLTSIVLAFHEGWKLTLVTSVCAPIIIVCNGIISKLESTLTAKELESYGKAGSVAEEVFSSIKTVMSFGGEGKEIERYKRELESSREAGLRRGRLSGAGSGIMWFIIHCSHGLCFWYGVSLILESREANNTEYTPSVLIIVFFGVLAGAMNMGLATPHLEAFSMAKGAAVSVFSVIERTPAIDSLSPEGETLSDTKGKIRFQDVTFSYPARPEIKVLKGIDLEIRDGEMVALVGSSGSGKSTLVQLMQRLYDPSEGSVSLDGRDLRELNVGWLRRQLGVVGQEPSLFGMTIYENIKFGRRGATKKDVENAAKLANAHDFIMKFPKKYDTVLGRRGTELSGGQKQRIAIARALIRNPKILILDEATSALDVANERTVQMAMEKASEGRTTVIVTHKLSNIKNADRIVVLSEGKIVEEGTHEELVALRSHYFGLLEMQFSKDIDAPPISVAKETETKTIQITRSTSFVGEKLSVAESGKAPVPEERGRETVASAPVSRIMKCNGPEWPYLLIGSISALLVGGSMPALAVMFGELYGVLSETDADNVMRTTSLYSGMFLLLGIITGLATFLQRYTFNYAGVALTSRMRILTFSSILGQEAGWFDDERHGVGTLCARLSGDASSMQGATGSRISVVLQSLSTLLIGALLAFFYSWKMTLVTLVTVPGVFFGVYLEAKTIQSQTLLEKKSVEKATKVALEAISNIRIVATFGLEQTLLELYDKELLTGERKMHLKSVMRSVAFALGQTAPYICYGISLWYGGILVADEGLHYKNLIKVSEALLYGSWTLGQSLAFAPNFVQAKLSAGRIFEILDREPETCSGSVIKDPDWRTKGRISMSQVKFRYPTRPEVEVLKGFDLSVEKGQSIALVGPSGCGKSTVVQILQRIYDPFWGSVRLDEHEISELEVSALRRQYGVVSQDSVLFDRTIAENIAYGDNSRQVTHGEIVAAAKSANIHDFISCLPAGYRTRLGTGGAQLSGGQKQRIAIARALIRNPAILLLDEATSALDATSESLVQAALNDASEGRTTITISHRPRAMLGADVIHFLDRGRIVESRKHEELLEKRGKYAAMLLRGA